MACRAPVPVVGGRFWPAAASTSDVWQRLVDGSTSTASYVGGGGAKTSAVTNGTAYITLNLDGAWSVSAVSVWPLTDTLANIAIGQGLTIWLHSLSANFSSDSDPVKCVQRLKTTTRWETYSQCPLTPDVRYVTLARSSTSSVQLGLQEVRVYRAGEPCGPCGPWAFQTSEFATNAT